MATEKKQLKIPKTDDEPVVEKKQRKPRSDKMTPEQLKEAKKERNARYASTEKGMEAHRRARAKYYESEENKQAKRDLQRKLDFVRLITIKHCDVCDIDTNEKNWYRHSQTKKHQKNLSKA